MKKNIAKNAIKHYIDGSFIKINKKKDGSKSICSECTNQRNHELYEEKRKTRPMYTIFDTCHYFNEEIGYYVCECCELKLIKKNEFRRLENKRKYI